LAALTRRKYWSEGKAAKYAHSWALPENKSGTGNAYVYQALLNCGWPHTRPMISRDGWRKGCTPNLRVLKPNYTKCAKTGEKAHKGLNGCGKRAWRV
jgi:hypothetical protein